MLRSKLHLVFLFVVFGLGLLCACSNVPRNYSYVSLDRLSGWKKDTGLMFKLDIPNSQKPCQIYFAAEIRDNKLEKNKGYPITVTLISPDSLSFIDTLTLPLSVIDEPNVKRASKGIIEIQWPYRKNIYNSSPGTWDIIISKRSDTTNYSNILGFGVFCKHQ